MRSLLSVMLSIAALAAPAAAQTPSPARPTAFEGARLIVGDGSAPIEAGVLVVQNGQITAVGAQGAVSVPPGAARVNVAGRTIMPGLVNAHVHIGYEGYTSWGAKNYTPANVLDHLRREAYYGVAATQSVGSSPTDAAIAFVRDQQAGKFAVASRFFFMPGMAPPGGGPDAILIKATNELKVVYEVSTGAQARAAVQGMLARGIRQVKIWVDDRRGTYPKMTPEVYTAVIDEAHRNGMLVHAHAIQMADQKAVVRAGADVLVHTVQNEPIDEELMALLREKKPYWTTVIGLGDRSEACEGDPFVDATYPEKALEEIRAKDCAPRPADASATRERILANNLPRYVANGARLVLGTDAGIDARHAFGWADHHELSRWVQSGVSSSEAIVAATSRAAALIGIPDLGSLAPGKSADFLVLLANPLDDIRNTRRIDKVYIKGVPLDRAKMAAEFKGRR
ncbi:MAG TPA: amidohydrolase family protein [Vicinamibacterales bacterium]|nr:amidohydrolase family protein [Vicinamibacterales bacterium]